MSMETDPAFQSLNSAIEGQCTYYRRNVRGDKLISVVEMPT